MNILGKIPPDAVADSIKPTRSCNIGSRRLVRTPSISGQPLFVRASAPVVADVDQYTSSSGRRTRYELRAFQSARLDFDPANSRLRGAPERRVASTRSGHSAAPTRYSSSSGRGTRTRRARSALSGRRRRQSHRQEVRGSPRSSTARRYVAQAQALLGLGDRRERGDDVVIAPSARPCGRPARANRGPTVDMAAHATSAPGAFATISPTTP